MAYYSQPELEELGFKKLGSNVKISKKASIYNPQEIVIGDYSRIDDFCIISGNVMIGAYNHVTPMCLVAGGKPGICLADFCTLSYGVKIFAQSDDYSGSTMVNSMIPKDYKNELFAAVEVGRQSVFGAASVILPGVKIAEGCSFGAMSLVTKSTHPWGIYWGQPARRVRERKRDLLELERQFLAEMKR